MCGLSLRGKDCVPFLEKLVVADVARLAPGTGSLTAFTNEKGGAIDDSVITKGTDEHIYLVVNADVAAKAILEKSEGKVRLTGLGARDSLRLEAGLCLWKPYEGSITKMPFVATKYYKPS
ncbi:Aminomethyltransferase [Raphanus sativus]|nr:Aminomethyltransferase [Raphanus sativus]